MSWLAKWLRCRLYKHRMRTRMHVAPYIWQSIAHKKCTNCSLMTPQSLITMWRRGLCVCVCVCVCVCACIYLRIHLSMHIHTIMYMCVCTHIYIYMYMYMCIHTNIYTQTTTNKSPKRWSEYMLRYIADTHSLPARMVPSNVSISILSSGYPSVNQMKYIHTHVHTYIRACIRSLPARTVPSKHGASPSHAEGHARKVTGRILG